MLNLSKHIETLRQAQHERDESYLKIPGLKTHIKDINSSVRAIHHAPGEKPLLDAPIDFITMLTGFIGFELPKKFKGKPEYQKI